MDPLPEVEMIPHDIDGLHILQLKVNAGQYTPYYYVGDGQRIAFVRIGDESLPATAEQMLRLVLKGSVDERINQSMLNVPFWKQW